MSEFPVPPTIQRHILGLLTAATFTLLGSGAAQAQRVIRIVVPFGPGAVQDTVARAISNELGAALGASVIVENRAGAGGTIGTAAVAKSAPDGNTLVLAAASHNIAGHMYSKLGYDPVKDFIGVAYLGNAGYVIAAPGNMGINTLADYVRELKAKPGQYNYASAGNGSATHLGMAGFLAKAGLQMTHIPMKSTGDAVNEVLAGRAQGVQPGADRGRLVVADLEHLGVEGRLRQALLVDAGRVEQLVVEDRVVHAHAWYLILG